MKFGASLSDSLVPEWKAQYVDYKDGKKIIKKVSQLYIDLNGDKTTDVTPLLNPLDEGALYVPDDAPEPMNLGELALESRPKQSMFSFSNKSSKNKKEEFYEGKAKFTQWLNEELDMVNNFYKEKERDIYERFLVVEDQFFQLKEHRMELAHPHSKSHKNPVNANVSGWYATVRRLLPMAAFELPSLPSFAFMDKWKARKNKLHDVRMSMRMAPADDNYDPNMRENRIRNGQMEYDFDDLLLISSLISDGQSGVIQQQPSRESQQRINQRDYVIKRKKFSVPYFVARRQLKQALIEHYRSISLLKSYRVMNRTAFRKITKKYDKALQTSICKDFMDRVDNSAFFQTSTVLDKIASRVEDLFVTFFDGEKTDRKHGLEKLRSATFAYNNADIRLPLYYEPMFGAGFFLGIGIPLVIIALYNALEKTLSKQLPEGRFLLQIWGGFFLMNLMMLLVGVNFIVFNKFKINYKFIFEFNMATALDYHQYLVLPCFGFAFLGILSWLSFQDYWPDVFPGRDFPLIYLAVCLIVFLWPGAQLYPASRKWFQVTLWRLVFSGLYPVEFRDFSNGDMFCSLTYSLSNLSFFICQYSRDWRHLLGGGTAIDVSTCGSNRSRTMGFLAALPSVWRFLQCMRRFMDSGDAFPHLANMIKYLLGVSQAALLSLWRIDSTQTFRVLFIVFASLNSIYCSIWDVAMDWSLGQSNSKHFLLRDHLFFGSPVYYYVAIVVNVTLRFQWIFYAFFSHQIQQLAITSFSIALAELVRRFIWFFFRMENEHCTNVILFRASRDSPLPYMVPPKVERAIKKLVIARYDGHHALETEEAADQTGRTSVGTTTAYSESIKAKTQDEEQSVGGRGAMTRRKSTFVNISDALKKAHIKDFQRRKTLVNVNESDEDEDDDEDASLTVSK